MEKGMDMNKMPYEIDMVNPDLADQDDHIAFVNDQVGQMRARGFEAQVMTYDGPGGGAAVVRFGPGTRSFDELNEFIMDTYDPDWFDYQVETA